MKDKTVAAMLAFFLGTFGAHYFYIGDSKKGLFYLLFTIFGIGFLFIPILALIDFIKLLNMSDEEFYKMVADIDPDATVPTGSTSRRSDVLEILTKYKKLLDTGMISQGVFDKVKTDLLK